MNPKIPKNLATDHEVRSWSLRCRGWSQSRIAAEIGVSQPAVSKILARVEARELKRLSGSVERIKVHQTGELEHCIEESLEAWHKSKLPRKRAGRKVVTGGGGEDGDGGQDEVTTSEVIEREGETAYLDCAMRAMDRIRSLWGLDVQAAMQEPVSSIAELARDLMTREAAYDKRRAEEGQAVDTGGNGGTAPAGAQAVQDRPEPV